MASTRTYESALNTECDWKELGTYLDGVLVGEEVDDLERVRDNADGKELLAVVAAVHHHANQTSQFSSLPPTTFPLRDAPVDQTLNNRHLRLLELLLGITASGVGKVDGVTDLDVIGEGDVLDFDTFVGPIDISSRRRHTEPDSDTHSWVSHLPNSFTS